MDKSKLLTLVSEPEIFKKYYSGYQTGKNVKSPFSEDKNPSLRFYKNNTFKCFSSGKQGDCFQFVADVLNIDCKQNFADVLGDISNKFSLKNGATQKTQASPILKKKKDYEYALLSYTANHLNYWKKWKVEQKILQKYGVFALDKLIFTNSKKEKKTLKIFKNVVAFAYIFNDSAEFYIPEQEKAKKFYLNKTVKEDIFGYSQLAKSNPFVIIAAGKKDCIILNSKGFPAVSFRSENHYITKEQIEQIKEKTKQIFICYDNDMAGMNFADQLQGRFPEIAKIQLPSSFNDAADFFLKNDTASFQKLINEAEKCHVPLVEGTTIFHITEKYLKNKYKFRYNEVNLNIEYCLKNRNDWEIVNENSLFVELNKSGIKCSINNLIAILKSNFVQKYNPLCDYFLNLPNWDGKDYIKNLCSFVHTSDNKQFVYHFKKWAVRAVKCVFQPEYFNKQAFILVHKGQSSGKSTFCRFLCPPSLSNYLAEDISNDKDARILLCKNFLINLDELAVLSRKEINSLKAYFSKTVINERLPYDRKNSILPRVCSFIGSTNMTTFLNDDSGSVRWLCFELTGKIDFSYKQKVDINSVWAQAFALAKDDSFDCELSIDDIEKNEDRNRQYMVLSTEQELISKYFRKPKADDEKHLIQFFTSTEILMKLDLLGLRLNKIAIGKALNALNYERIKHPKRQVYGYFAVPQYTNNVLNPIEQ